MLWPAGRVKPSVQPVSGGPEFVIVMVAVRPVFQALTAYPMRQPPEAGGVLVGGVLVGGMLVGGGPVGPVLGGTVVLSRPRDVTARSAIPDSGSECRVLATLIASTGGCADVEPYRVRVQPACGVSVSTGVCETPSTLVHCLISSAKFGYRSVESSVPCHTCIRGRAPV